MCDSLQDHFLSCLILHVFIPYWIPVMPMAKDLWIFTAVHGWIYVTVENIEIDLLYKKGPSYQYNVAAFNNCCRGRQQLLLQKCGQVLFVCLFDVDYLYSRSERTLCTQSTPAAQYRSLGHFLDGSTCIFCSNHSPVMFLEKSDKIVRNETHFHILTVQNFN